MGAGRLFALALAVSGCSTADPCDGVGGICLSARVEGNVSGLDQLRVSLDTLPNMVLSPMTPSSFSLPVKLAVVLPPNAAGNANITIEGMSGGHAIASTGKVQIAIPASGKFSKTFTLGGAPGDGGGGGDGPIGGDGGADMTPTSGVVVDPLTLTFPNTPRGTLSPTVLPFTITNYNMTPTSLTNVTTIGDMNSFKISPDPAAAAGCQMMMPSVPPGMSCRFNATFQPATSGVLSQQNALTFSDGTMAKLTLNGTGTPAWALEGVPIGTGLEAVWGSSANDLYAVGHDMTGNSVFHSKGDGVWTPCAMPAAILRNVYSISGDSAGVNVMIGLDSGQIYQMQGGTCQWTSMATANAGWPTSSNVRGLYVDPISKIGYAVSDAGFVAQSQPGSGAWNQVIGYAGTPTQLYGVFVLGGNAAWVGAQSGVGFAAVFTPAGGPVKIPVAAPVLRSLWGYGTTGWVVGDSNAVERVDTLAVTSTPETIVGGATGGFTGISGRIDPMTNMPDIYAVGFFGNQLLHSTGDGMWHSIPLPDNSANAAVWVAPTGEVIVAAAVMAGSSPHILHYY